MTVFKLEIELKTTAGNISEPCTFQKPLLLSQLEIFCQVRQLFLGLNLTSNVAFHKYETMGEPDIQHHVNRASSLFLCYNYKK